MRIAWAEETRLGADWPDRSFERFELESTKIDQTGYVDEFLPEEPEAHARMVRLIETLYVSPRYKQDLEEFRRWRESQL